MESNDQRRTPTRLTAVPRKAYLKNSYPPQSTKYRETDVKTDDILVSSIQGPRLS